MCFGVAIGTSLGSSFDNMALGSSLGLCIGMAIGLLFGSSKDKKINEQIEKEGYIIKAINEKDDGYIVSIVNKMDEITSVNVSKEQMKEEKFSMDDVVFLSDDKIEQAYSKEDA